MAGDAGSRGRGQPRRERRQPPANDKHQEPSMRQNPDQQTTSERDALGQYLDYQRETIH